MPRKSFLVSASHNAHKIDRFLNECDLKISRRKIRRTLDSGCVSLNNKIIYLSSTKVFLGDKVDIFLENSEKSLSKRHYNSKDLSILYEDSHVVVINKLPHLLSQGTYKDSKNTAEAMLKEYMSAKGQEDSNKKFYLCHRLDKETSGVLVFAKTQLDCDWIMEQFKKKTCKKTYHAICIGSSTQVNWMRKDYLSKISSKTFKISSVNCGGKLAITNFKVQSYNKNKHLSFVECFPLTGRSHQIRFQLFSSGLSIVGDKKYCRQEHTRLNAKFLMGHHMLHAYSLKFSPSKNSGSIEVVAPYPSSFADLHKHF